ncbi:MAG TPA: hypothetical protein VEQ63_14125 [Bryobacteraceae bacterium]|nr:hypothetical protein [Bryobacteraceae bacterium]
MKRFSAASHQNHLDLMSSCSPKKKIRNVERTPQLSFSAQTALPIPGGKYQDNPGSQHATGSRPGAAQIKDGSSTLLGISKLAADLRRLLPLISRPSARIPQQL